MAGSAQGRRESAIVEEIITKLRKLPSAYAVKIHGGMYGISGEPDINACVNGRMVRIEVKRPETRSTVSPNQHRQIKRWNDAGALAFVACSWTEVEATLRTEGLVP